MLGQDNITLRPLNDNDAATLSQLANNKKIWDNLRDSMPFPYTIDHAVSFINSIREEKIPMTFAIEYEGQLCGVISVIVQNDIYSTTAVIGYWIGEPFWNKGIATIAVKLITDYGFNQLGFLRIHTGIFEHNTGSMKVLEKNGYKKDCIFEKALIKNGKIYDEHRFSKIK
jgi:[ribosomal protein S5]-alanine N-acetyltransferase